MLATLSLSTRLHHQLSNVLVQSQDPTALLISKPNKKHHKKTRRFQMMVYMGVLDGRRVVSDHLHGIGF